MLFGDVISGHLKPINSRTGNIGLLKHDRSTSPGDRGSPGRPIHHSTEYVAVERHSRLKLASGDYHLLQS